MDIRQGGADPPKTDPPEKPKNYAASARQFRSRGCHLTNRQFSSDAIRHVNWLKREWPLGVTDRERKIQQEISSARKALAEGRDDEALSVSETTRSEFNGECSALAQWVRLRCDEIRRDGPEPLGDGKALQRKITLSRKINQRWAALNKYPRIYYLGIIPGLLASAHLLRTAGDISFWHSDDDYAEALSLANGINNLILGPAKKHIPEFVLLFRYERALLKIRIMLSQRKYRAVGAEIDELHEIAHETGDELVRVTAERKHAEYLLHCSRSEIGSSKAALLSRAEKMFVHSEEDHKRLRSHASPYAQLSFLFRKLELFREQGRGDSECDQLLNDYAEIYEQCPNLYYFKRLWHLECRESRRLNLEKLVRPTFVSTGLLSLLLDERLIAF